MSLCCVRWKEANVGNQVFEELKFVDHQHAKLAHVKWFSCFFLSPLLWKRTRADTILFQFSTTKMKNERRDGAKNHALVGKKKSRALNVFWLTEALINRIAFRERAAERKNVKFRWIVSLVRGMCSFCVYDGAWAKETISINVKAHFIETCRSHFSSFFADHRLFYCNPHVVRERTHLWQKPWLSVYRKPFWLPCTRWRWR